MKCFFVLPIAPSTQRTKQTKKLLRKMCVHATPGAHTHAHPFISCFVVNGSRLICRKNIKCIRGAFSWFACNCAQFIRFKNTCHRPQRTHSSHTPCTNGGTYYAASATLHFSLHFHRTHSRSHLTVAQIFVRICEGGMRGAKACSMNRHGTCTAPLPIQLVRLPFNRA